MQGKDCSKEKKAKPDLEDINRYEDVYDMKKLKEDVGIPLYPKPKSENPLPTPAADQNTNQPINEIEKLQSKNEVKN